MTHSPDRNAILMCECRRVVMQGNDDGYCPYCHSRFAWRGMEFVTLEGSWSVVGLLSDGLGAPSSTPARG